MEDLPPRRNPIKRIVAFVSDCSGFCSMEASDFDLKWARCKASAIELEVEMGVCRRSALSILYFSTFHRMN